MRNSFPGTCYRCGWFVEPGSGFYERTGRDHAKKWPGQPVPKWLTQHAECAVKWRGSRRHYQFAPDAPEAISAED